MKILLEHEPYMDEWQPLITQCSCGLIYKMGEEYEQHAKHVGELIEEYVQEVI